MTNGATAGKQGRPLRLVHNVTSVAREASGPSYSVIRLCESLQSCGETVSLLTQDGGVDAVSAPFIEAFRMGIGPRKLGRSPEMYRWLTDQAALGQVDILHTHGLWMMTNVYPGWVARRFNIPLVVSPRGTFTKYAMATGSKIKRLFWPFIQRPALAPAVCFHATGESEYEDIRRIGFTQPIAVIPNGIDVLQRNRISQGKKRRLLFLSRIHPHKGLEMLLPAWRSIQEQFPEWELQICGDDNDYHGVSGYLEKMKTLAKTLELKRVIFSGAVYGEEKFQTYCNADLYVLPTFSENFGVTIAEALAQATPAIVTKGAPWQGLENAKAGWWIDIGEAPLTAALAEAMAQPQEQLQQMGENGQQWMKRDYSWRKIARSMDDTYRWICDPELPKPEMVRTD